MILNVLSSIKSTASAIPLPGVGSLVANGILYVVLQKLRPTGEATPSCIARVMLRAFQALSTAYWMDMPIPMLWAAGAGLVIGRREEEARIVRSIKDRAYEDDEYAKMIEELRPWSQQKPYKTNAKPRSWGSRRRLNASGKLELQRTAERRMSETRAHMLPDTTPIFKLFAETFSSRLCDPEQLSSSSSEAVLRITSNTELDMPTRNHLITLRRLAERYVIYERRASCVDDINRAIDWVCSQRNKTIRLLWINAHGSPVGILLQKNQIPSPDLGLIHFSRLAPRATIFLDSCQLGQSPSKEMASALEGFPSPAEFVKLAAGPHRRVFAAMENIHSSSSKLLDPISCTFAFYKKIQPYTMSKEERLRLEREAEKRQCSADSLWLNYVDHKQPITMEPLYEPAVSKLLAWRNRFSSANHHPQSEETRIRRGINQVVQAVYRLFCCCRKR